jgi:hypothetical protein
MSLTDRELWTLVHGMGFGAIFLLSFTGVLVNLYNIRSTHLTLQGIGAKVNLLRIGTIVMAVASWITVIMGSFVIYGWYRVPAPTGANMDNYPKSLLISNPETSVWHDFAMEWKEHVAWFAPILATVVAFIVIAYGPKLAHNKYLRYATMTFFVMAFATAGIAGMFGALITKEAPLH